MYETSDASALIATMSLWIVGPVGEVDHVDWLQEQSMIVHDVAVDDLTGADTKQISLDLQWREGRH